MGHFSHNCKLTGVPITGGKAVLIVMKPKSSLYDNSEEEIRKYGSTYMCSNDGTTLKFEPVWFPIMGEYNTYGNLENIVKNTNTRLLEEHYGLTIEEIVGILTCGRKRDGYSGDLNVIKKKPLNKDDFGKPEYEERYHELLTYSGMWVDGDVYEELTKEKNTNSSYKDEIDLGTPGLLEYLGFEKGKVSKTKERYNIPYIKDGFTVWSDGTWIETPQDNFFYNLKGLKKYCKSNGVEINIDEISNMDLVEQELMLAFPPVLRERNDNLKSLNELESLIESSTKGEKGLKSIFSKYINIKHDLYGNVHNQTLRRFYRRLLNFSEYNVTNPMFEKYVDNVNDKDLQDSIIRFWRFNGFMFACGKYYEIVGTGPQDGEIKMVQRVLEVAKNVVDNRIKEYREDYGDEDE